MLSLMRTQPDGREPDVDETPPPGNGGREPLAYFDVEFLESIEGRPLRILSEYLQPLRAFRLHGVHDTIVFFGSARVAEDGPLATYYQQARELARMVTEWSQSLHTTDDRFLVCTGGGPGIMEAANPG